MLNRFDKFLRVYKYIYFIIYLLLTAFFTYILIDSRISSDPSQSFAGLGFALVVLVIGSITYGVYSFINLIIMFISIFNKDSLYYKKNNILTFIMFILPIVTEIILVLIGMIYFN